jgi:hypothetical protein
MNKLPLLLLSSILLLSSAACSDSAKTSTNAPEKTTEVGQGLDKPTAQTNQSDASSETRRQQLNSDIRAREQRNNTTNQGQPTDRNENDLKSEVRSKLEANLPASQLAVDAKDGTVTVSGTVVNQQQRDKIEPLVKQIKGVQSVATKVAINEAAKPK